MFTFWLSLLLSVSEHGPHNNSCIQLAYEFCNNASLSGCPHESPPEWIPLKDGNAQGPLPKLWRCYSPECLNANHTAYKQGSKCTAYCTRDEQIATILATCKLPPPVPPPPPPPPLPPNTTEVFTPGEAGYPCLRIPSIIQSGNILNAFAECRNFTGDGCLPKTLPPGWHFNTNRDICQKQSLDGGKTWGPLVIIGRNAAQPTPVIDTKTNKMILQYVQLSPSDSIQIESADNGKTWSSPVSICKQLGTQCGGAVGPGIGIQLQHGVHAGRLLFIGHYGAYGHDSVWYSDDDGETYKVSQSNLTFMDEAQLVETSDGTVIANMRNNHHNKTCNCRGISISKDGGTTFGPVFYDPTLIEPVCMGSILLGASGNVYFANPASVSGRVNGTIRMSSDGFHWEKSILVYDGDYGYSCLTNTEDPSRIGLLWESSGPQCVGNGASCRTLYSTFPESL
eukprot:m.305295 g.305295  ORF g.305295 m.305295 type:complete len:452 (-) comp16448_c0_seq1:64-1419(-)